jgi:Concanavalin A-like lectin/glucanases superfamily
VSYLFVSASNHFMERGTPLPVASPPLSVGVWIKADAAGGYVFETSDGVSPGSSNFNFIALLGSTDWKTQMGVVSSGEGFTSVNTTNTAALSAWHSATAVWASTSLRRAYIDGGDRTDDDITDPFVPATQTFLSIGYARDGLDAYYGGRLAYVFIWNIALTDAEVASWHGGSIPQQANLIAAYDMTTDHGTSTMPDAIGSFDLAITGATFSSDNPSTSYSLTEQTVPNLFVMQGNRW